MLTITLAALLGLLIGLAASPTLARWLHPKPKKPTEPEPMDEWTAAAIDQAAVQWVKANHLPDEAAGLMVDKLRLLHRLGSERGWH